MEYDDAEMLWLLLHSQPRLGPGDDGKRRG